MVVQHEALHELRLGGREEGPVHQVLGGHEAAAQAEQADHTLLSNVDGQVVTLAQASPAGDQQRSARGAGQGSKALESRTR